VTDLSQLGFWRLAAAHPDAVAVIDPAGQATTRGQLLSLANSIARVLRGEGLVRGDRVVGVIANRTPGLALVLACQQIGAYFVPVNTSLAPAEMAYIVTDAAPIAVVASSSYVDMVRSAVEQSGHDPARAWVLGSATEPLRDLLEAAEQVSDGELDDRSPGSYLGYTSGTTGRPKGVLRKLPEGDPDDVFAAGADWQLGMFGIEPLKDGVHLVTSPLSHTAVSGLAVTSLHYGHAVVLMDTFKAEAALQAIQDFKVTTTHMVPTQLHRLLRLPAEVRDSYDVSSMRNLVHGAGPCSEAIKRGIIDWFGPVVWEYYGATEAAGTTISSQEWLTHPGSVGRPQPGAEVRIFDEQGADVPVGQAGGVYLAMGRHRFEYRGDEQKTQDTRRGDYVTVGDLGYVDAEGYLYLLGRTAEVIVSGGVNVYPAEVENALLEHPQVQDVGVIGTPDDEWGESVHAVVQPSGAATPTPEELADFLRERLARFKVPRRFTFVPELPRGANGKLRKHQLRDLVATVRPQPGDDA
jgi:long-chain acyl-CoA synthetase